jgi:hypothetical protein
VSASGEATGGAGAENVSPDGPRGAVDVGRYVLEVGGAGGTLVKQRAGAAREDATALERALREKDAEGDGAAAAATGVVEDASEVTAKIERAVALGKGIGEGKALNPDQLVLEVGALLDLLGWLDRQERFKDALRLARALVNLLMLLRRWVELLRALRAALRAGEKLGDLSVIAWAKHELGTLRVAAGDVKGAELNLCEAQEIREGIGDRRGLAATNGNLHVLCKRLREMLREEELVRRHDGPSALRLLAVAALFVLLFGGGVAAGVIAANSNDPGDSAGISTGNDEQDPPPDNGGSGGDGPGGSAGQGPGETEFFRLSVIPAGDGGGTVIGGSIACPPVCEDDLPEGEQVTLEADADEKSIFEGFLGKDCSGTEPCRLTMDEEKTVTATFAPVDEELPLEEGDGGDLAPPEESK